MSKGQRTREGLTLSSPRETEEWLRELDTVLNDFAQRVYEDIKQGNSSLTVSETKPTVDDLDDGQRVLYYTGTELRTYITVNGVLYYSLWTEVI